MPSLPAYEILCRHFYVFGDFITSLKSNPVISSAAIKNFGLDTEHYFDPPDLYEAKDIGMVSSS